MGAFLRGADEGLTRFHRFARATKVAKLCREVSVYGVSADTLHHGGKANAPFKGALFVVAFNFCLCVVTTDFLVRLAVEIFLKRACVDTSQSLRV